MYTCLLFLFVFLTGGLCRSPIAPPPLAPTLSSTSPSPLNADLPECPAATSSPPCTAIQVPDRTLNGTIIATLITSSNGNLKIVDERSGYDFCCLQCSKTTDCTAWNVIWDSFSTVEEGCNPPGTPIYFLECQLLSSYSTFDALAPSVGEFRDMYGIMLYETPPQQEPACDPEIPTPHCADEIETDLKYVGNVYKEIDTLGNSAVRIFEPATAYRYCCSLCSQDKRCIAWNVLWINVVGDEFGCQPLRGLYFIKCQLLDDVTSQEESPSLLWSSFFKNACAKKFGAGAEQLPDSPPPLKQSPPPLRKQSPPPPKRSSPPPCPKADKFPSCKPNIPPGRQAVGESLRIRTSEDLRFESITQGVNWCCGLCRSARKCKAFNAVVHQQKRPSCGETVYSVTCSLLKTYERTQKTTASNLYAGTV